MRQESHAGSVVLTVVLAVLVAAAAVLFLKVRVQAEPQVTPVAYEAPPAVTQVQEAATEETFDTAELTGTADPFDLSNTRFSATTTPEEDQQAQTTQETTQQQNASATTGDYICAYSSERQLTAEDVNAISAQGVAYPGGRSAAQMIINEMYAYYGFQFTDPQLQAYFNQKSWYQSIGTYTTDMSAIFNSMTAVEQANINYLSTF